MSSADQPSLSDRLEGLRLQCLEAGEAPPAGLWVASLPLPRGAPPAWSLEGRLGMIEPLGQWWDVRRRSPRRLLLFADSGGTAPPDIAVTSRPARLRGRPPAFGAGTVEIARGSDPLYQWQRHALVLHWRGRSIELVLGLVHGGELHWWEACRLVSVGRSPDGLTGRMGGVIPVEHYGMEALTRTPGYNNPYLHRHNWINGTLFFRLHANGVCEVFARHVNSKFFDDGATFQDVVPVIGFRRRAADPGGGPAAPEPWDGRCTALTVGDAVLDMRETARLATPAQPGRWSVENGFVVLQPYQGVEIFGGAAPLEISGDPYLYHAAERVFPRGMARTLRFSISLNPDRGPGIVRYQAPAWWYGCCEELTPQPYLPVSNAYDRVLTICRDWSARVNVRGGFEDGALPRHARADAAGRQEAGWEGETGYGQFLDAWRSGNAAMHADAVRNAYFVTDTCVDHAVKTVRMHGFPAPALAIPMARVQAAVAAYLETGDPYLIETARAVIETTYWVHKNSWPRLAVGRDACFIRGAVMLFRYLGETHYRRLARDAVADVLASQRDNGTFGDQGGGSGIHQWAAYITKPWMALMALGGVIDYLELLPNDRAAFNAVRKFADWLLAERFEIDGLRGWGYQHDYDGHREHFDPYSRRRVALPGKGHWHQDSLGRVLTLCSERLGDPRYFKAWEESFNRAAIKGEHCGDHYFAAAMQFVPWVQAHLWRVAIDGNRLTARPLRVGADAATATVATPFGPLTLEWDAQGGCRSTGVAVPVAIG